MNNNFEERIKKLESQTAGLIGYLTSFIYNNFGKEKAKELLETLVINIDKNKTNNISITKNEATVLSECIAAILRIHQRADQLNSTIKLDDKTLEVLINIRDKLKGE